MTLAVEYEQVAEAYDGNKQKIAEAMAMGIVNPLAGMLAGMFIDRMRSAQMLEQAPQTTVAQQVMGGLPPAPQAAPPQLTGGLGATPQAMPPMAPPQQETIDVPMPSDEMPQMAAGGLTTLPVPDAMFDEPDNGGYATGGLVAFANGGTAKSGFGDYIEQMVRSIDPNIQIAGRARTPSRNAEVGGVPNSYHLIDAARDISTPEGMSKAAFISQLKGVLGPDYDVLPSKGNSVHVEPGPKLGERVRAGARPTTPFALPQEVDTSTAAGRAISAEDSLALGRRLTGDFPREELERARKYALEQLDPETQEKQAKADMWEGLAAMGFRLASSNSPNILQAIGEAATATLPELKLSKKERKAAKDEAVRTLMAIEDVDRKTAIAGVEVGIDIYKTGISADQAAKALAFQEKELASRENIAMQDRNASLMAASLRASNPDKFDRIISAVKAANPKMSDLEAMVEAQKKGLLGGGQGGMVLPGDPAETGAAGPWSQYQ